MRPFRELAARLRQLLRRRREDAETETELRFPLEMETEKNLRAGLPSACASSRRSVAAGVLAADAVVRAGVLLLLSAVCAAAFVAPALPVVRPDVSRALQVD